MKIASFTLFTIPKALVVVALFWGSARMYAEDSNLIDTRISCLSLGDEISGLKFASAGEVHEIPIYTTTRSKLLKYTGPRELVFFREQVAASGELVRVPVGKVRLKGDHSRYLLFFSNRSSGSEAYSILPMPDSHQNFQPGTFRFINLAPFDIAIKINNEERMLKKRQPTDIRGDFENGKYQMTAMVSLLEGQEPFLSYSGRIHYNENMRMIYLIRAVEGGRPGKIRFKGIPDLVKSN